MIEQPVALITGASRGLGRALALAFGAGGYAVGINFKSQEAEAKKTELSLHGIGTSTLLLPADVTHSSQVNTMVKTVLDKWGRLDVLVNNAGVARNRTIAKMSDEEWRDVMAVNLDSVFYCTRAAIPFMRERRDGAILNMASYIAPRGTRGAANYAAAKAAVITFTKNTALEEGRFNIRANALMPGFHITDMNRDFWEKNEKDIRAQHLLNEMPTAKDMAEFAVQVAKLKSVTGQVFSFESRLL